MSKPSTALRRLVNGYQLSQAIHVAATLGVADLLADGPRDSGDLAAATGTHPRSLYRLLRALAGAGIFQEEAGDRFALTSLGECLRSDHPESVAGWAMFICQPYVWEPWGHLLESVRTGEDAFTRVHGMESWEYRARHAAVGAAFDHAMATNTRRVMPAIVAAGDFGRFSCVVDVGGGHGAVLAAILTAHPGIRGILFDQPHVVAGAETVLQAAGVSDRCEVVGGSFFEAVPEGGDAYLLKSVLHDWADDDAVSILRTCRQAIATDGRLLIIERLIAPPNEEPDAKFSDLNMLVELGGQERTRDEYADLFARAGFRLIETAPAGEFNVIEAVPC